jgi:hypothetical protein
MNEQLLVTLRTIEKDVPNPNLFKKLEKREKTTGINNDSYLIVKHA